MSGEAAPRLKTNLAILVAGDAAGKLINFFVFGSLGRILEKAGYGKLGFVLAAVSVGTLVIDAGLAPFGARAVARGEEPQGRILGRILALRSMILGGVIAAFGAIAAVLAATGDDRAALMMTGGAMLVGKAALCDWLFQGRHEMHVVSLTNLLDPLVALALTLMFVHGPEDLGRVPWILAAAPAATAIAQHAMARRRGVRADLRHGFDAGAATLRESLPLGLSTLAWGVRFFSPMIAVALVAPADDAGAFTAAHQLTVALHAVVWLYFFNLLPLWARFAQEGGARLEQGVRRSLGVTLILCVILVLGVRLLAPVIIPSELLYGAKYRDSAPPLLGVLVLVPALAWVSGNFRFALIAKGALATELLSNVVGAACAVAAFAVIGRRLDVWTAVWVFCAAEAATLVTAWWSWIRQPAVSTAAPSSTARAPGGAPPP
jgi:O-antigen/teichoic acid export membrane protein